QSSLPVSASTATRQVFSQTRYIFVPATVIITGLPYPAPPPFLMADRQRMEPLSLLKATMEFSSPPGVAMSLSPSISTDSLKPQMDIILPPSCCLTLDFQRTL